MEIGGKRSIVEGIVPLPRGAALRQDTTKMENRTEVNDNLQTNMLTSTTSTCNYIHTDNKH